MIENIISLIMNFVVGVSSYNKPSVKESINLALKVFKNASTPMRAAAAVGEVLVPPEPSTPGQLLQTLISTFNALSDELIRDGRVLVILLDNVQYSSDSESNLLKGLIPKLPPAIAFIITFRMEDKSMKMHEELLQELYSGRHIELRLGGMTPEEIKDFAKLRCRLSVDDPTAELLSKTVDDPRCLACCFYLLQKHNMSPSIANVKKVLPEAGKSVRSIYFGLNQSWRDRVNSLCILRPPMSLSIIACMLEGDEEFLKDELDNSGVFKRLRKEEYDFSISSLRKYCLEDLPRKTMYELYSQAAKCFETLKARFPELFADLSRAEYLFHAQDYEKALKLNLQLGDQLYNLSNYGSALQLTERAKTCAEKTNDRDALATSLYQIGMVYEETNRFKEALDFYNQNLKIEQEIGDRSYVAATLHQIGRVYEGMGHSAEALDFYNQSLKIEREISNREYEARTLHQIGIVYQELNQSAEAQECYNQSLNIKREIGDLAGEARTLHQIGTVHQKTSIFEWPSNLYNQRLDIKRRIDNLAQEPVTAQYQQGF